MSESISDENPLDRLQKSTRRSEELLRRLRGTVHGVQGDNVNIIINGQQSTDDGSKQPSRDRVREVVKEREPCAALQESRERLLIVLRNAHEQNPLCKGLLQQLNDPQSSWGLLQQIEESLPFLRDLHKDSAALFSENPYRDFFSLLPYIFNAADLQVLRDRLIQALNDGYMTPYDLNQDEVSSGSQILYFFLKSSLRSQLKNVVGSLGDEFNISLGSFPVVGKRPGQLTSILLSCLDVRIPNLNPKKRRNTSASRLKETDRHFREHSPVIRDQFIDVALVNLKNFLSSLRRGDFVPAHEYRNGIRLKDSKKLVFFKRTSTHDIRMIEKGALLQTYE